ncbi:SOS cell division inhibitor [uncultured Marinobacter sp.]|uniref:SOS cell division inhibitor n=1 Tax=uncultured Marinobacter sp. TaxID=187379 RepID=UPI0030D6EEE0|tara:strand:- start:162 stop:494 length:333 start_codon:yes stop_codon:yes gene_type:complete
MATHNAELEQLDTRIAELKEALDTRNWDLIGELNASVPQFIEPVMQALEAGKLSPTAVQKRLETLRIFCDSAEADAREAREEAAKALKDVGKNHKAAKAYARVSDGPDKP